jgi:Tetratricopeptide repeat
MNNLAEVLRSQGKYEAAEEMHQQALELWRRYRKNWNTPPGLLTPPFGL